MAKTVSSGIQVTVGPSGPLLTPVVTGYTEFYQPTAVRRFAGGWVDLPQEAISTAPIAALCSRKGVWVVDPEEDYDMTVRRNIKEFGSMFDYIGPSPTNPELNVYDHDMELADPTSSSRRYFTKVYEDEDMVSTLPSLEANGFTFVGSDRYIRVTIPFLGTHVCHCQFSPTVVVPPATYTGILYARGIPITDDLAVESFDIEVVGNGAIDGTATIQTKHSTDIGFSTARPVYNNEPFPVEYGTGGTHGFAVGTQSGIELMFTEGANNILDNVGPDSWTVSTRGVAPTPTYPVCDTVFVPRNFEWRVQLDSANFRTRPKEIRVAYDRALGNDDYGWGSDISNSHPLRGDVTLGGSLIVEKTDQQFLNWASAKSQHSLSMLGQGFYVGASIIYRQTMEFTLPQIEIMPFGRDLLKERTPVVTVPWRALPSTPAGFDVMNFHCINSIADLHA